MRQNDMSAKDQSPEDQAVAMTELDEVTSPATDLSYDPVTDLTQIRAGDVVSRLLGGHPMGLKVTSVDENLIYCGKPGVGWSFDRVTGVEVDEEIGWGPQFGITGSYLVAARRPRQN
jgi:hypothetical protein